MLQIRVAQVRCVPSPECNPSDRLTDTKVTHALHQREPFPTHLAMPVTPTRSVYLDSLLDLAFQIPPLLQAADSTIRAELCEPTTALIKSLIAQEKALLAWIAWFDASKHHDHDSNPVRQALNQPSSTHTPRTPLFDQTCASLCRTCLLLVSESLSDLHNSTPQVTATKTPPSPTAAAAAAAADTNATALCDSIVTLAEAAENSICRARALSGPLHFLSRFYARSGDSGRLRWCVALEKRLKDDAPYLRWSALLPWTLITLTWVPEPQHSG